MINSQQARWASQHDWYLDYLPLYHGVMVRDYDKDGAPTTLWFTSFTELRNWAGY